MLSIAAFLILRDLFFRQILMRLSLSFISWLESCSFYELLSHRLTISMNKRSWCYRCYTSSHYYESNICISAYRNKLLQDFAISPKKIRNSIIISLSHRNYREVSNFLNSATVMESRLLRQISPNFFKELFFCYAIKLS